MTRGDVQKDVCKRIMELFITAKNTRYYLAMNSF